MELLVALITVIGLQLCDSVQMLASEAALANLGGGGHRRGIDVLCAQMVWLERVCKHWDCPVQRGLKASLSCLNFLVGGWVHKKAACKHLQAAF